MLTETISQCKGNGKIIVLLDSNGRLCDTIYTNQVLLSALRHMGIPFCTFDIAHNNLTQEDIHNSAGIIIGQNNLIGKINKETWHIILDEIKNGLGLINFDINFFKAPLWLQKEFGLQYNDYQLFSNSFKLSGNEHYINTHQQPHAIVSAKKFTSVATIKSQDSAWDSVLDAVIGKDQMIYSRHVLPGVAIEPSHIPAVLYREMGKGNVVFYTLNSRFWLQEFYGHGNCLDELFFRSIVWTARKPFITKTLPAFVSLRIDDCSGIHDFKYIDIMAKYGFIPTIACFLDNVDPRHWPMLKKYHEQKKITLLSHAFSYYDLLYFDFGKGEYPDSVLEQQFQREERILSNNNIKLGKLAHGHCNEIGTNALHHLKYRQQTLLELPPFSLGEIKPDRMPINVYPYASSVMGYGVLPEDSSFFRYFCSFRAEGMNSADFLEGGLLTWLNQNTTNDITKASLRGAKQINLGLMSKYFGQALSHEQKFSVMSLDEIDSLFKGLANTINYDNIRFKPIEEIVEYLKYHSESHLTSVDVNDDDFKFETSTCAHKPEDAVVQVHYEDYEKEMLINQ